jgi:hypothetical protein
VLGGPFSFNVDLESIDGVESAPGLKAMLRSLAAIVIPGAPLIVLGEAIPLAFSTAAPKPTPAAVHE